MTYLEKLNAYTPTRFWVNNPTLKQAGLAVEHGALGCTTNPSHLSKVLGSTEDGAWLREEIRRATAQANSAEEAAALTQRAAVGRLAQVFLPVFRASGGRFGYVSIQGDPYKDDDVDSIILDAEENLKLAGNIIPKIPVTEAGLGAIAYLAGKGYPVLATEVMGLPQAVAVCELYKKHAPQSSAPFYVTHITGIFNEYLQHSAQHIAPDILASAGLSVARRQYRLMCERGYPGSLMGGGVRSLSDFTGLVGGQVTVTINWAGTADKLQAMDMPLHFQIDEEPDAEALHTLLQLDDFRAAWEEDGMRICAFAKYGPVQLFRSMFVEGWDKLFKAVCEVG